ncbi:Hypothetical predicted protein [Paramuricea clavata]|uniref:Uncharacterized protein n=1 Tax=Paramuricea clavata TaxID=317549 RepID=A0A6S7KD44_PARCT|nr:Hypothetical predicted protein [Paramuricea clavata]
MENVCDQMKSYVSRARRKFPYIKGVKSHFREGLDNLVENSAVKLNIETPPDDLMDDSTKEIIRLKFKCVYMLEEYEEDITEWYFQYREQNLLDWLCKLRVLNNEDQGCLGESDDLVAPEDDTTTTVYTVDDENQYKSPAARESEDESENEWHNRVDNIDFSESHLEL